MLVDDLIQHFSPKSTLDIKTQVFLVNKLAKDDTYKRANQTILLPLWRHLGEHYKEYKNLLSLQREQIGILVWSFGHADLDILKRNYKLWNSFEIHISQKIGL